jgi:hypothetical protein
MGKIGASLPKPKALGGGPGQEPPPGTERHKESYEQALAALGDIDPMKHAGEGWFSTEEYANPADIDSPYVRGDIIGEGDYYPPPDRLRKPWPPHRR